MCGELTFKTHRQNFMPLIKKYYELYTLAVKWVTKIKVGPPHICRVTCVGLITRGHLQIQTH